VLDVAGRVRVSRSGSLPAGTSDVPLTTQRGLPPGLYIVRLQYRGLVLKQTVVVLR